MVIGAIWGLELWQLLLIVGIYVPTMIACHDALHEGKQERIERISRLYLSHGWSLQEIDELKERLARLDPIDVELEYRKAKIRLQSKSV